MLAQPFSLFYNAFNMKLIHACFGFVLDITTTTNNKLYLHDYNKVLQYCKSHLKFNY